MERGNVPRVKTPPGQVDHPHHPKDDGHSKPDKHEDTDERHVVKDSRQHCFINSLTLVIPVRERGMRVASGRPKSPVPGR
jgi:hypothetical protein